MPAKKEGLGVIPIAPGRISCRVSKSGRVPDTRRYIARPVQVARWLGRD